MKSIAIQDIRLHWPKTEKLLQQEQELIVTRDGRPVARLEWLPPMVPKRPRFDATQHAQWQTAVFGRSNKLNWVNQNLKTDRADRPVARHRSFGS